MELEQIRKKIRIIFENQRHGSRLNYVPKNAKEEISADFIMEYGTDRIVGDPTQYKFEAPNVDLLRALMHRLNSEKERKFYWTELENMFIPMSDLTSSLLSRSQKPPRPARG